ncbi:MULTISPECIES: S-adenosyl-l-methionine hydroxide adenosyltransferase family protein [unclassified Pseudofrankia]|uniref:SAM hydrolase/SAM-dependent halogenase family protein n=1 Tax=unclassified Pseudofrankia TaxID=2994372 RepID=UPI0009F37083|nr:MULTISPECIES: SAM-dependent chlorinase/fluorinase [unclassified Pseudofrankia]MDT3438655.1 SAM-dependent chlorinase/fluorinase [Pseudofrankia sp. BMG5.37]
MASAGVMTGAVDGAAARSMGWISFLSDYGLEDTCVGVCHGVIARHAPQVRVLDVCHAVAQQDIEHGAGLLADSVCYLPVGVHLAVVERLDAAGLPNTDGTPGIPAREVISAVTPGARGVAIRTADGSTFVAPDNGLTSLAWDVLGGVAAAHEISNPALWLPLPSAVFRGRDVYAPVAARIAAGLALAEVGPRIDADSLVRFTRPSCVVDDDHVHAQVLAVDHFGNLSLNVTRVDLEAAGMLLGDRVEIRAAGREATLPFTYTYGDVPVGQVALCEDSLRRVMLAVNCGRASDLLRLRRGDAVVIGQPPREPHPGAARAAAPVVRLPALT